MGLSVDSMTLSVTTIGLSNLKRQSERKSTLRYADGPNNYFILQIFPKPLFNHEKARSP